jgi:hypothetical protein
MMDNAKMSAVRFAVPSGNTRDEMRDWLKSSEHGKALYALGDCLLVWANEGDLFRPGLSSPLGVVEATLDAAHEYLVAVYGHSPLAHPVDRARINAIRTGAKP